jgi:hypothetical protein
VSQTNQGNKQSKQGSDNRKGRQKQTVREDTVGSSDGDGIRFKVPAHPDKSVVRSPEK